MSLKYFTYLRYESKWEAGLSWYFVEGVKRHIADFPRKPDPLRTQVIYLSVILWKASFGCPFPQRKQHYCVLFLSSGVTINIMANHGCVHQMNLEESSRRII